MSATPRSTPQHATLTRRGTPVALLLALGGLVACNQKTDSSASKSQESASVTAHEGHVSGEHSVKCGCAIEEVGECGNYVEVDGKYVELVLPESSELGPMAFCGKDGLVATVEGEMSDQRVVASSFELKK